MLENPIEKGWFRSYGLRASSDLCVKTYQRRSVPSSSLRLSTYGQSCYAFILPPVFDRSAMQGCRGEYIIYFSIKIMSMQRSSSEDRTTGWFFLERSPIFWIEKVIYSCICSDLTAVVRRILTAIYGQNTVRMVEYSQCVIHGSLTANPTATNAINYYSSKVYCIHSAKSQFEMYYLLSIVRNASILEVNPALDILDLKWITGQIFRLKE